MSYSADNKDEPRTTLTGKPIERKHDSFAGMMNANVGFVGDNAAGANLLPPGYTDASLVRIPIKDRDLEPTEFTKPAEKPTGFFRKLSGAFNHKSPSDDFKIVMMSRGDYLKYWAKGEDGHFLPSVEEPPQGRKEWVRKQLELNEQWKRDNPSLANSARTSKPSLAEVGAAAVGLMHNS